LNLTRDLPGDCAGCIVGDGCVGATACISWDSTRVRSDECVDDGSMIR
jgi:hypothetical protein